MNKITRAKFKKNQCLRRPKKLSIVSRYDPSRNNLEISKTLTDSLNDQSTIKHFISDSHKYLLKVFAMQCNDDEVTLQDDEKEFTGDCKIINVDLQDPKSNDLFAVIRKGKSEYKWEMLAQLYTKEALSIMLNHECSAITVPRSSSNILQSETCIDLTEIDKIVDECKWSDVIVHKKSKNRDYNGQRLTLSITKERLNPLVQETFLRFCSNSTRDSDGLIPIVMFDDHSHWMEYVFVVHIYDFNIGISVRQMENGRLKITGIHLDKDSIQQQHELAMNHECHCLDTFESKIHDLIVDDPNALSNQVMDYKQRNERLKMFVQTLACETDPKRILQLQKQAEIFIENDNGTLYERFSAQNSIPSVSSSPVLDSRSSSLSIPSYSISSYSTEPVSNVSSDLVSHSVNSDNDIAIQQQNDNKDDSYIDEIKSYSSDLSSLRNKNEPAKTATQQTAALQQILYIQQLELVNHWYFLQTLNPTPQPIIPHLIHKDAASILVQFRKKHLFCMGSHPPLEPIGYSILTPSLDMQLAVSNELSGVVSHSVNSDNGIAIPQQNNNKDGNDIHEDDDCNVITEIEDMINTTRGFCDEMNNKTNQNWDHQFTVNGAESDIQITIEALGTLGKEVIEIEISPNANVEFLKMKLHTKTGYAIDEQKLLFSNKQLENNSSLLSNLGITHRSVLYLTKKLRGGCFIGESRVSISQDRLICIKDVQKGAKVLTFNFTTNQVESHEVKSVLKYRVNELVQISFSDNSTVITCTTSHPFWVPEKNNWCCVRSMVDNTEYGKLCPGDSVMSMDKKWGKKCLTISNIQYKNIDVEETIDVYTLHIHGVHNFFIEGILVHNAMEIYFKKQFESKSFKLDVEPNDTIKDVKVKIHGKLGILPECQKLIVKQTGSLLDNDYKTLKYYEIQKECTLIVCLAHNNDDEKQAHQMTPGKLSGNAPEFIPRCSLSPIDENGDQKSELEMKPKFDWKTLHITDALITTIKDNTNEQYFDIKGYIKTFMAAHGTNAYCVFTEQNKQCIISYAIINCNFRSKINDEFLYVIAQNKSGYNTWKTWDRLYGTNEIDKCKEFSIQSIKSLSSKWQYAPLQQSNSTKMRDKIIKILSDATLRDKIIYSTKWTNRKQITIHNISNSDYSLSVCCKPGQFVEHIQSFATKSKEINIIPVVRYDNLQSRHCLQYVWPVKIDEMFNIGIAFRAKKKEQTIEVSGIHLSIRDSHQVIIYPKSDPYKSIVDKFIPNLNNLTIANSEKQIINILTDQVNSLKKLKTKHEKAINKLKQRIQNLVCPKCNCKFTLS